MTRFGLSRANSDPLPDLPGSISQMQTTDVAHALSLASRLPQPRPWDFTEKIIWVNLNDRALGIIGFIRESSPFMALSHLNSG